MFPPDITSICSENLTPEDPNCVKFPAKVLAIFHLTFFSLLPSSEDLDELSLLEHEAKIKLKIKTITTKLLENNIINSL
jgi:hypothetical protein